MILGVLVVISGQMSLKIVDFCPAKVISNSRLLGFVILFHSDDDISLFVQKVKLEIWLNGESVRFSRLTRTWCSFGVIISAIRTPS